MPIFGLQSFELMSSEDFSTAQEIYTSCFLFVKVCTYTSRSQSNPSRGQQTRPSNSRNKAPLAQHTPLQKQLDASIVPTTFRPRISRPSSVRQTTKRPKKIQPTTFRPKLIRPTTSRPQSRRPTTLRTQTVRPTTVRPRTIRPRTVRPTTFRPRTVRPTTFRPRAGRPTTFRPRTGRPTTFRPKFERHRTSKPQTKNPTIRPRNLRPTTSRPMTRHPTTARTVRPKTFKTKANLSTLPETNTRRPNMQLGRPFRPTTSKPRAIKTTPKVTTPKPKPRTTVRSRVGSRTKQPNRSVTVRPPAHIKPLTPRPRNPNSNMRNNHNRNNRKNVNEKQNLNKPQSSSITHDGRNLKVKKNGIRNSILQNSNKLPKTLGGQGRVRTANRRPRVNNRISNRNLRNKHTLSQLKQSSAQPLNGDLPPRNVSSNIQVNSPTKHNWDAHLKKGKKLVENETQNNLSSYEDTNAMIIAAKYFFPLYAMSAQGNRNAVGRSTDSRKAMFISGSRLSSHESQNPHGISITRAKPKILNSWTSGKRLKVIPTMASLNIQDSKHANIHSQLHSLRKQEHLPTFFDKGVHRNKNNEKSLHSVNTSSASNIFARKAYKHDHLLQSPSFLGKSIASVPTNDKPFRSAFGYSSTSSFTFPPAKGGNIGQTFHVNTGAARSSFTIYG